MMITFRSGNQGRRRHTAVGPKVDSAVILAAGMGRRLDPLTRRIPKPLLPVAGVPLLDKTLAELRQQKIHEVTLVVGHRSEQIQRQIPHDYRGMRIDYIESPEYARTNNSLSLWLAREKLEADCLLLEGDVVFDGSVLTRLLAHGPDSVSAVDTLKPHMTGTFAKLDDEKRIQRLGIRQATDLESDIGEQGLWKTLSIHLFKKEFSKDLLLPEIERTLATGQTQEFYEESLARVVQQEPGALAAAICEHDRWIEIDDFQDYGQAQLLFSSPPDDISAAAQTQRWTA